MESQRPGPGRFLRVPGRPVSLSAHALRGVAPRPPSPTPNTSGTLGSCNESKHLKLQRSSSSNLEDAAQTLAQKKTLAPAATPGRAAPDRRHVVVAPPPPRRRRPPARGPRRRRRRPRLDAHRVRPGRVARVGRCVVPPASAGPECCRRDPRNAVPPRDDDGLTQTLCALTRSNVPSRRRRALQGGLRVLAREARLRVLHRRVHRRPGASAPSPVPCRPTARLCG